MKKDTKDWLVLGGVALGAYALMKFLATGSLRGLGDADPDKLDIGKTSDLCDSVSHLLALEDHLTSSAGKTGDPKFVAALDGARKMRREMMAKLVPENAQGELWCIVKHVLASSIHAREVGDKLVAEGRAEEAQQFYAQSEELKKSAIAMSATAKAGGQCPVCRGG